MIRTEIATTASAPTVHELLVDVEAWPLWSPHVASLDAPSRRVETGWVGQPRAFFAPIAVAMAVDEVTLDRGYRWHSTLGPWRLDYHNEVESALTDGSLIRFSAELTGPGAGLLETIVGPLSARGQRRRMARLAELAELVERNR